MTTKSSGTDTRRRCSEHSPSPVGPVATPASRASLGSTVALTVTLAVACFVVVLGGALLLVHPQPIAGLEPLAQRQDAETGLYVAAFAVILPLALIFVPRVGDAVAAGPNARALSVLVAFLVATMVASVIVARVLPGEGAAEALVAMTVWWIGAIGVLARARAARPWPAALRIAHLAPLAWMLAATVVVGALLAFATLASISLLGVVLGLVAVGLALVAYTHRGSGGPSPLSRGWGFAIDAAFVVVLALAIPNLVIFHPLDAGGDFLAGFQASVIQFHQNFLLGPANQVLAGDAVLVGTSSQYGVAPIYLLAAWFQLAPIGYGTAGFLDGILYALMFVSGYCVLRLAGTPRLLSAAALALAVIALLYNLLYPVGGLLQHGPLRFGLPMGVILAATLEARSRDRARAWRAVQLVVVGLSAIWALEALAYTVATFAGIAFLQAWSLPPGRRLRWLERQGALALGACVVAHLVFAAATLVFAGHLPDWGQYTSYLNALVIGKLADITYDFSSWSAGVPVGVAYAASAAAVVLLVVRRPAVVQSERPALTALTGVTAYGIALFTYFVNRSADDILPYVSFPAVLAGALWLSLLLRGALSESRSARVGGLAFALSVSVLVLATAWSSISERFPQTPLAHVVPGGESLASAMNRLWVPPPIDSRAPQGEVLLERYMPGERRVPIVVSSDLGTEILMRSGRANELPFDDPTEDFFVGRPEPSVMRRAVAELEPGDRMLIEKSGLRVIAALESQPGRDLLDDPVPVAGPYSLLPAQQWILGRISERFRLRVIDRGEQGFLVVQLAPRRMR